ncbi:UPF0651 protein P31B10.02, mitochondrial isoform X1 [Schistocerca americana]|uniref:UPF0651 protein P31B10.02, mitochondrial isoform X1 n=2 Tax=Schistocerca americana TaxID=7009 RepID=UPI001F4FFE22|nr:UPF0651 protein P31B10.02, mitochondrial isoform X1 [Schistocerca americana]
MICGDLFILYVYRLCGIFRCRMLLCIRDTSVYRHCISSDDGKKGDVISSEDNTGELPEEPTNCCMSGCENCVWIQYAEELLKRFSDGDEKARTTILSKVSDPSMKSFLLTELKMLKMKKS